MLETKGVGLVIELINSLPEAMHYRTLVLVCQENSFVLPFLVYLVLSPVKDTDMTESFLSNLDITAEKSIQTKDGLLLTGSLVSLNLPFQPKRYLRHGWQSWSLTAWMETSQHLPTMRPSIMHPMQTDPAYALLGNHNGSWYGAVDTPDGKVLLLGSLMLDAHVELSSRSLRGWNETENGDWFISVGDEFEVLTRYAKHLGQLYGKGRVHSPPRVWCSWYSLYTEISEVQILKILNDLGELPFDVFQIDDGWQVGIGDWKPNAKFPSGMDSLAARIRKMGRIPGFWLAPLLVVPSSDLYHDHPDWLLHDEHGQLVSAGFNWSEPLYALDTTHPRALDWLKALMKIVRSWGYEYVKLDFLYAGALPGKRHVDIPREIAYRNGLETIRATLGDAYILACGAPIIPSLGLCDGIRVGPDVAGYWDSFLNTQLLVNFATPGVKNALRTVLNRLWLQPLVHTDPDVTYFRTIQNNMMPEQKCLLQDLAQIAGFKATSDIPSWLTEAERFSLREFLESSPQIVKTGQYKYQIGAREVDFTPFIKIPPSPDLLTYILGAVVGGAANVPLVIKIFDQVNRRSLKNILKDNLV